MISFLKILSWICICNRNLSQVEELRKELGVVILNFKLQFNVTLYMITLRFPDFAKSENLFRASSPYLKRASSFQRTYTFWKKKYALVLESNQLTLKSLQKHQSRFIFKMHRKPMNFFRVKQETNNYFLDGNFPADGQSFSFPLLFEVDHT